VGMVESVSEEIAHYCSKTTFGAQPWCQMDDMIAMYTRSCNIKSNVQRKKVT
jgi:hypothetical protein